MTIADSRTPPTLDHEHALAREAGGLVCGVDEAGRGPLAGPVVAAAVVLDPAAMPDGIRDSKLLAAEARAALFDALMHGARVGVGVAECAEIDRINILQATFAAMGRAVAALGAQGAPPAAALVDGNRAPKLPCPARTLVAGDMLSLSVAAASIVAKVTRDRIMCDLAGECPGYGWQTNMGYGTAEHRAALASLGVTRHHRRSFRPVAELLVA